MRGAPETQQERQARLIRTMEEMRNPELARGRRPPPPVIGTPIARAKRFRTTRITPANLRIYDYLIEQKTREARRHRFLADQMEAADQRGEDINPRALRSLNARHSELQTEITELRRLRDAAPQLTARRGTTAQRGGQTVDVSAASVRQFRGGETREQINRRIAGARRFETERGARIMERIGRVTEQRTARAADRLLAANQAAILQAYRSGEYSSSLLRAARVHGALGAGIGLTVAGLGLLAHHVAAAGEKRRVEKIDGADDLAKARRSRGAADLAAVYRRWIDRLLGRTEDPMNLGDGHAAALGGVIADSFARGAINPPIDSEGSDPRYRIDVDFDVLNPSVRRHMAEYALDRIVDITQRQRDAIRDALMTQSVLQGIGPRDVARTIRNAIGLTGYQQAMVQSFRSQLVALDPRALERKLRDRRYDRVLQRAIETGTPLTDDQLNAMEDAYHRRMLALRAETIARTESIRATTYGGLARAQQVLDQHPELDVIKVWHSTHDDRTRPTHVDLDLKQADGMLTPWITSAGNSIRWPFDDRAPAEEIINCRCFLEYRFVPKRGVIQPVSVMAA